MHLLILFEQSTVIDYCTKHMYQVFLFFLYKNKERFLNFRKSNVFMCIKNIQPILSILRMKSLPLALLECEILSERLRGLLMQRSLQEKKDVTSSIITSAAPSVVQTLQKH